jgi:Ino eighty subunit 2
MSSRPRRSAATKAKETISVHAQWANSSDKDLTPTGTTAGTMSSRRSNRNSGPSIDVRADSYLDDEDEPMPASTKQRQAARSGGNRGRPEAFEGGEIIHGKRDRGGKKSYVVESSPDDEDDDDDDEEAQIEVDDEDEEMEDAEEDAEGEEEMDMDAEGDVDMDIPAPSSGPTIKISRSAAKPSIVRNDNEDDDDDDDDDLSDPGDSDAGDQTLGFGDETGLGDDEDAEGDEIEVAGELGAGADRGDSDEDGSQDGEVDLGKMTKRQRARFEEQPQDFMKLSDGGLA